MRERPLYVTPFEDESVKPFTARCRACGQIVKKRGYTGHAKSHVGARFVIDGTTYGVRELIDSPHNRYFLRREKPDVVTEGEPDVHAFHCGRTDDAIEASARNYVALSHPGRSGDGDPPPPLPANDREWWEKYAASMEGTPHDIPALRLWRAFVATESSLASQRAARARAEEERETAIALLTEIVDAQRAGQEEVWMDRSWFLAASRLVERSRASGQPEAVSE